MLHRETNMKNLCFTGGTALNCVANGRLLRESPFERIFVPPSPHDGGTALGCALYGWIEHLHLPRDFRWVNDFLGPEPETAAAIEQLLRKDNDLVVEKRDDLIEKMVDLLVSGRIVSLFQGRSELGPRALGHRSILADPRNPRIRSWINRNVKGRELFRPLAPAVLLEAASIFFDIDCPVPFMQFAASVRPEYRETIPAVTHVDGTARLQTVSRDEDPFFYSLIKAFEARTGIPVLLNTSFNGKGEPIVETPHEAIACFKSTAMHALAMPPFLIRKRVESPLPD
jgi:carbamoyltransferase